MGDRYDEMARKALDQRDLNRVQSAVADTIRTAVRQAVAEKDAEIEKIRATARAIHERNAKLIGDANRVYGKEQSLDARVAGVNEANAILTEEVENLRAENERLRQAAAEKDAEIKRLRGILGDTRLDGWNSPQNGNRSRSRARYAMRWGDEDFER